jgi:hypothetical protein
LAARILRVEPSLPAPETRGAVPLELDPPGATSLGHPAATPLLEGE